MAPQERSSDHPISWLLVERPQRFEFFEAIRLLEQLFPHRAPVGGDAEPRDEVARFRAHVALDFPAGDIQSLVIPGSPPQQPLERPAQVSVQFMGLANPNSFGSLPLAYAVCLLEEVRDKRYALRDFLDIFNHRFVSLFYRAWSKARLPVASEGQRESYFERALFGLMGLGTPELRHRLPLPDRALLSRAGLLLRRPASALAIEALVQSLFGVPARVEPFRPTCAEIDPEDRTRIGAANARLGIDTVLGSRVVLRDARFRLRLGPLTRAQFEQLLPHGDAYLSLCRVVRLAVSADLEFDVQLILRAAEVPRLQLSRREPRIRLGRSMWMLAADSAIDRDDPVLQPPIDLVPSQAEAQRAA